LTANLTDAKIHRLSL